MEKRFNFYGNTVITKSENQNILDILIKNFSYFEALEEIPKKNITILDIELLLVEKIPYHQIPPLISSKQTRNAVVYETKEVKYCDYYQEGLVIFDKVKNSAKIYCLELDFLHELSYLFIMSKIGKALDLQGFHRIHACAFKKRETSIVCMMPMKGGKSTLFLKMMEDREVEYFSDDTPLINSSGKIYPFPIRVGIKELPRYLKNKEKYIFEIKRKEFGSKNLIEISAFENKIALTSGEKIILVDAVRTTIEKGYLGPISNFKMILPLFKYMGIGLGLPIIIEFFLENGFRGWRIQLCILFKRLYAIARLLIKSKSYRLILGTDRDSNVSAIQELWH